jgi:hypothetical protein
VQAVQTSGVDRLGHLPELAKYVCFAVDMHWHKAGAHDERHDAKKVSVGHTFSLNMHDHSLRHLAAAEGEHEHDMSVTRAPEAQGPAPGRSQRASASWSSMTAPASTSPSGSDAATRTPSTS